MAEAITPERQIREDLTVLRSIIDSALEGVELVVGDTSVCVDLTDDVCFERFDTGIYRVTIGGSQEELDEAEEAENVSASNLWFDGNSLRVVIAGIAVERKQASGRTGGFERPIKGSALVRFVKTVTSQASTEIDIHREAESK